MKKLLIIGLISLTSTGIMAQAAKKPATAVKKTVSTAPKAPPAMKNAMDSFSYAIGLSIANFYKQQGVSNINTQLVMKALSDVKANKPLLNEEQTNNCIVNFMQTARSEKASGSKKAGAAFLAENKRKSGVVTLPSGLQYMILTEGQGPKPTLSDNVKCHYTGSFID